MSDVLVYKDNDEGYSSFQAIQAVVDNYNSNLNDNDAENNEDGIYMLSVKKQQLFDFNDPGRSEPLIETIKNMIIEGSLTANQLVENDFYSIFSFLIKMDSNVFYRSLYDLLTKVFDEYVGDIKEFVSEDILIFLNHLSDENSFEFISNLSCIASLLRRENSYKFFFINNKGFTKLINLDYRNHYINPNILDTKVKLMMNVIALILDIPNDVSNELIYTSQDQICIYKQIYKILFEFADLKVKSLAMISLDAFIRYCFKLSSSTMIKTENNEQLSFLIYDDFYCNQIAVEVMKCLGFNDEDIVRSCLDIIAIFYCINKLNFFEFDVFQNKVKIIFGAFRNDEKVLLEVFKLFMILADDCSINFKISEDIITNAIQLCDSEIFTVKSKSIHFLAILVQMSQNSRARSIIEKFPIIIEIFCDFIHAKEAIVERVLGALTQVVELSLNQEFTTQNNSKINVFQVYELIDIDFLYEFKLELEHNCDNIKEHIFFNTLANIKYLISIHEQITANDE
ncbi:hypothetical protein M9Y10_012670 [Tritrichomonas musculus]|uniref:Uncharacterized protein n=1 Tax=Tritrichomonas musculus TaxID=1915356 RepID=A0ABR2ID41_9EUKA